MAEGRTPTPAVFVPDVLPSNLPYASIHEHGGDPVEDQANFSIAAAHAMDPLQFPDEIPLGYPSGENGSRPHPRATLDNRVSKPSVIICLSCSAIALIELPCHHGVFARGPSDGWDWTYGRPFFGGPMSQSQALPSGVPAPYSSPSPNHDHGAYGWQYRLDPSVAHCDPQRYHSTASSVFVPTFGTSRSTSCASVAGAAQVDGRNVQAERCTTGPQPAASAPSVAGGPDVGLRPPRFNVKPAASGPAQVQASSQSAAQERPAKGQGVVPLVNRSYVALIHPFDASVRTWYVVIVGRHVGVFATEPSYARSAPREAGYYYVVCDAHDDAVAQFQAAEARGDVQERA